MDNKKRFVTNAHSLIDIIIQKTNDTKLLEILGKIKTYISVNIDIVIVDFYKYFGKGKEKLKNIDIKTMKITILIPEKFQAEANKFYPLKQIDDMLISPKFNKISGVISKYIVEMISSSASINVK